MPRKKVIKAAPGFTIMKEAGFDLQSFAYRYVDSAGGEHSNDLPSLFMSKARWDVPPDRSEGDPPLHRVILPPGAPRHLIDVTALITEFHRCRLQRHRKFVMQWTLYPDAGQPCVWDELDRAYQFGRFIARERLLPVILVMHEPAQAGSARPIHVHLLILTRVLAGGDGFAQIDDALIADEKGEILLDYYRRFLALEPAGAAGKA